MYYTLRKIPDGYRIAKFDQFFDVEAVHEMHYFRGKFSCDCPQGGKSHTCRHREMIPIFNRHKAVDTGKFYHYENNEWFPAVSG
jgi:hypothetical protein